MSNCLKPPATQHRNNWPFGDERAACPPAPCEQVPKVCAPSVEYVVVPGNIGGGGGGGASVVVSETPPSSTSLGMLWYDPEDRLFSVWDGTAWVGTEFLPITPDTPALAFLSPSDDPYLSPTGEYYLAPA